ncbi:MAG: GNAT family N-acetyltransferase [Bacteroidota bacterium]
MNSYSYQENLESERLRTRFLNENDIKIWAEFFENKEATEFLMSFGLESTFERAKHMIGKQFDRYSENRFGHQALIDKKSNEFIGLCGLLTQEVDGIIEIEVGYHILKKHWGKGYAPEAAKLFIDYAFENKLADSVISVIDFGNVKSQRVAEKNGLKIEKEIKYHDDEDVYIYRVEKVNWQ